MWSTIVPPRRAIHVFGGVFSRKQLFLISSQTKFSRAKLGQLILFFLKEREKSEANYSNYDDDV